ncbi:MAG: Fe(3+) ABC transporter substrate-binding protein [Desulfotignum sp.]|nr:Fe(3+) ABC transporter substrate-binding protein [Desulfotignum sp.]MCF8125732.1 Fe(3+) ABC transporter substrate-binding protein [Desulfotignum sp.]
MKPSIFLTLFALMIVPALASTATSHAAEVNIYSARQEHLIKPLLDTFTQQTGIRYRLLTGKGPALLERLKNEGRNSPADVLITVDVGNLVAAKQAGVLQPVSSQILDHNIPSHYRDDDGFWYGLSARSRVIFYAKDRVDPARVDTWEKLAEPALGYRVCVRSSSNIYNQSLMAAMIAHHGEEKALDWAFGLVKNFGRKPQDNDTGQIRAVAAGECDVAIANTYYYARLMASADPADQQVVEKVALLWPNQAGRGTHMNLSGAGIARSAKHVDAALALIEFLSGETAQAFYSAQNNEYPVNPAVPSSGIVSEMGDFKADTLNLSDIEKHSSQAIRLMDRAGWR